MASAPTMTNRELGELVGLTHSSISRIRSSRRWPSIDAMQRIAAALDWPVEEQVKLRARTVKEIPRYAKELERRVRAYQTRSTSVPG